MSERDNDMEKTQSALRILEAMSGIEEELLLRSELRRRPFWTQGRAVAACLALLAVGGLSWNALRIVWTPSGAPESSSTGGSGYDTASLYMGMEAADTDGQTTESEIEDPPMPIEEIEENKTEAMSDGGNKETFEPEVKEMDRNAEKEGNIENNMQQDSVSDYSKSVESCGVPLDKRESLSEEEARNTAAFGGHIPENMPDGYSFENAWHSDGGLTVTWIRGMDSIMISLSLVVPEDVLTVDVEKPETYDVRLYEIPYGETVPEKYHQVFDDPIFAAEDMSLEMVSSRMKSVADAGDTDTPRGIFSVLYPDGVMLRFNGRGTADEIWAMLNF